MYNLYDYHIHTTHSTDGKNTVFEICKSAFEKGLKEIAITDHFEPTFDDESYKAYKPYDLCKDIASANEIYNGKLKIKVGVELGQPHLFLPTTQKLLDSVQYDFILASVHKFASGVDASEIDYKMVALDEICHTYLMEVKNLVNNADFDCLGHIDLIKRYSANVYSSRITLMLQKELLTEIFKILISKGKGIEINTSGIRQAPKEAMPGLDVLKLYKSLGGEVLTLGSDAHCSEDVGKGIDLGIESARQAGFNYITIFDKRIPEWKIISLNKSFYCFHEKKII